MSRKTVAVAAGAAVLAAVGLGAWLAPQAAGDGGTGAVAASSSTGKAPSLLAWPPPPNPAAAPKAAASSNLPLSELGQAQRREQLALWQGRLERAQATLAGYLTAAQYPPFSRPIEEHPDQRRPFDPIVEERALRMPGGTPSQGVKLITSQERVFASGSESSLVTVGLQDLQGRPLPLRITRAVMREVTPPGTTARTPEFRPDANDAGRAGDAQAGDGVFSIRMQPLAQGLGTFAGTVRLELALEFNGQPGFLYFDLVYSPDTAAVWLPDVREEASPAGIHFVLPLEVKQPGRYVASARIADARGELIALAQFNAELPTGRQAITLPVFGKLLLDRAPELPLQLHDVEAFLLKPDTFPDRVMLPRRAGLVHTGAVHSLAMFSAAQWESEERTRYLRELEKDVAEAEGAVQRLGP
jgi:hypothetical protein